jgi:hypothetical protein
VAVAVLEIPCIILRFDVGTVLMQTWSFLVSFEANAGGHSHGFIKVGALFEDVDRWRNEYLIV